MHPRVQYMTPMRILLILLVLVLTTPTIAQTPTNTREQRIALQLARICISEAGFQISKPMSEYTTDCANIAGVLRRRSSVGRVTLGIMRAYSPKSFDKHRTDVRAYIPHLTTRTTPPRFWRRHLRWETYRRRFSEVYHLALALVQGVKHPVCVADHWGARVDAIRQRAHRYRWTRAKCGSTLNSFWRNNR